VPTIQYLSWRSSLISPTLKPAQQVMPNPFERIRIEFRSLKLRPSKSDVDLHNLLRLPLCLRGTITPYQSRVCLESHRDFLRDSRSRYNFYSGRQSDFSSTKPSQEARVAAQALVKSVSLEPYNSLCHCKSDSTWSDQYLIKTSHFNHRGEAKQCQTVLRHKSERVRRYFLSFSPFGSSSPLAGKCCLVDMTSAILVGVWVLVRHTPVS
jgi:hypothetical protein